MENSSKPPRSADHSSTGRRVEEGAAPQRKRSTKKKKKRSILRGIGMFFKVMGTLCLIGVLTVGIFAWIFFKYVETTLAPELAVNLEAFTMNQTSIVYYQDKETGQWLELQYLYGKENRIWLDYQDIPQYAIDATIAIEDKRFESHHGVDWRRTAGAVVNMFFGMRNTFGGSTITQQVIKNVTEYDQATVKRKVTEIFRALALEQNYSKEDIMENYLNKVYFGSKAYGIGAAAKTYFNKDVSELSLAQIASIIAITNNPSIYNPLFNNVVAHDTKEVDENGDPIYVDWTTVQHNKWRQENILWEMKDQGKISQAEYDQAMAEELVFYGTPEYEAKYGPTPEEGEEGGEEGDEPDMPAGSKGSKYWSWFVEQVFNDVKQDLMEKYHYSEDTAVQMIYNAGYKIYATVDPDIQEIVDSVYTDETNLDKQNAKGDRLQSGITIIDPYTGHVVATSGLIGEKEGNRLQSYAMTRRPCGSAFKPLSVYAPAIEHGTITMANVYDDYPLKLNDRQTGGYPKNSPTRYRGLVTVSTAVRYSCNTVAIRVLNELGYAASYEFLTTNLGFTTLVPSDLGEAPLAMGGLTYGVNTREMAAAFSAFANDGKYNVPITYTKVEDADGQVILDNTDNPDLSWVAMKETTAYQMNVLLKQVVNAGTGTEARINNMTVAGKTGTTSDLFDRYFVGYTPYYCAAVWVGYGYNTTVSWNGNPAAQMWQKVMSRVHEGLENKDFNTPAGGIGNMSICTQSGLRAGAGCPAESVKMVSNTGPTATCEIHQSIEICTVSGKLASEMCPEDCRESRTYVNFERENLVIPDGTTTTDPVTGEVTVNGTPILAEDNDKLLQSAIALGPCDVHTSPLVDPNDPNFPYDPTDPNSPWYDPTYDPNSPEYDPNAPTPTIPAPVDPENPTAPGDPTDQETPDEGIDPSDKGDSGLPGWLDTLLN